MESTNFFKAFLTAFIIIIVGVTSLMFFWHMAQTEVENYSVVCEVSHMAYAEEQVSRSNSEPMYKMGVRNDEFATTLTITPEQFAQFSVGDIVEVEVTVMEYLFDYRHSFYRLLGPVIE